MLCHMSQRYDNKHTFKSGKSIVLRLKGPVHFFLENEGRMNSDIYINQMLEELGLLFYKQCIQERGPHDLNGQLVLAIIRLKPLVTA